MINQHDQPGAEHHRAPQSLEDCAPNRRNGLLTYESAVKLQVAVFVSNELQQRVSHATRRQTRRDEPVEAKPDDLRCEQHQDLEP